MPSQRWFSSLFAPFFRARVGAVAGGAIRPVLAIFAVLCAASVSPGDAWGQAAMPATTTWAQASPGTSPPARSSAAMAYDAANGTVVLFGGYVGGTYLGDTWIWNGSTWAQTAASGPSARSSATMAYDAANGTIVLFGGFEGSSNSIVGDTWIWNGSAWSKSAATGPSARDESQMAYDAATGTIVLFGGFPSGGLVNDTWTWNGANWTQQSPTSKPSARSNATMAYDALNGTVVLFGGASSSAFLNDTWTWDGSNWTQQSPAAKPSARGSSTMAYDAATGEVVLFGGSILGGNAPYGDTWAWNGITWIQQSPVASPSGRYQSVSAYDAGTSSIVLFGGSSGSSTLADTWNYELSPYFGTVAVGSTGTATVTFNVTAASMLSAPIVLTQGAQGLDFRLTGTTCAGPVAVGTCTVTVTFTPKAPGQRLGAVELTDSSGNVITTASISGMGSGPLATFTPGTISTVAGSGSGCSNNSSTTAPCGDTGAATSATLGAYGVAVDSAGNLYIADTIDNRIRKVSAANGSISTVAGNGTACASATASCGDGTAATSSTAELNGPYGVAVDGAGNIYIADGYNNRVRKVTAATGLISTVAGNGIACSTSLCGDGTAATSATAELNLPFGVTVDGAGNLLIADYGAERIRKVTAATGLISTVAGNGSGCSNATASSSPCGDGTSATGATAELSAPGAVVVDGAGNLYIADTYDNRIRKVSADTGLISTVAGSGTACSSSTSACGDGGSATAATAYLNTSVGVALDAAGDIYIADYGDDRIRKVSAATGLISTVAGTGTPCSNASAPVSPCGDGTSATSSTARLAAPSGVAVDGAGNLFLVDLDDYRVREVSAASAGISFPTATKAGSTDTTDGTETVLLADLGNLPLTISAMQDSSASFLLANPMSGGCVTSTPVAVGGSCLLGEQFTPAPGSSSGGVTGSLTVSDNSLNAMSASQTVNLAGTAIAVPPTITGVSPNAGPQAGGTTVTITGTSLGNVTAVKFGTVAATSFSLGSSTSLTAVSPAGAGGTVDITVTNPAGMSATNTADQFSYQIRPMVTWNPSTNTAYLSFPLGTGVLDAMASVQGSFAYSYAIGNNPFSLNVNSTPPVGSYVFTATFTPTDTTHYTMATATINFTVVNQEVFVGEPSGYVASFYDNGQKESNATAGGGVGVAVDSGGFVWSIDASGSSVAKFSDGGVYSMSYSGTGLTGASSLAIDGDSNLWITNGNGSTSVVSNAGAVLYTIPGSTKAAPSSVSIDISGNVWIVNPTTNSLDEILGAAAPTSPLTTAVVKATPGSRP